MTVVIQSLEALFPPELARTVALGNNSDVLDSLVRDVLEGARAKWIKLAGSQFKTTRGSYLDSIQKPIIKNGIGTLSLVGKLADILETGRDLMFLHNSLLGPDVPETPVGSPGKHRSADGELYRSIPFRHQTPGSEGTIASRMGEAYANRYGSGAAKAIGNLVYSRAKELRPRDFDLGDEGERLESGFAPLLRSHAETVKSLAGVSYVSAPHTTDIYAEMVRGGKQYRKTYGTSYTTFRTISTAVSDKWIRPPTPGAHLAGKVVNQLEKIVAMAFDAYSSKGD